MRSIAARARPCLMALGHLRERQLFLEAAGKMNAFIMKRAVRHAKKRARFKLRRGGKTALWMGLAMRSDSRLKRPAKRHARQQSASWENKERMQACRPIQTLPPRRLGPSMFLPCPIRRALEISEWGQAFSPKGRKGSHERGCPFFLEKALNCRDRRVVIRGV
jgi:hypothetical protein